MEDAQIIELYWKRDEYAIQETKKKYENYCFSVASHILENEEDAKECVNDTWMKAWQTIPPKRPNHLRLYVAKLARNAAFDRYRSDTAGKRGGGEAALALDELAECVADSSDVEEQVLGEELQQSINRFLSRLPKRERSIFLRRYFFAEPMSEIARRYALKESHVYVILSRTRGKLAQYLKKEGYLI